MAKAISLKLARLRETLRRPGSPKLGQCLRPGDSRQHEKKRPPSAAQHWSGASLLGVIATRYLALSKKALLLALFNPALFETAGTKDVAD